MAGKGRRFKFHGAFSTKAAADRKHKRVKGSWVRKRKVRGDTRFVVMTER